MNNEMKKQHLIINDNLNGKKELQDIRLNINNDICEQKCKFMEELEQINNDNHLQLNNKDETISLLSENISKIRLDIANNLDDIRSYAEERNEMANHLLSY